jgi:uncharacterized protein DUF6064
MTLPFDVAQFFEVFARYNTAVWPAQVILLALAAGAVALAWRSESDAWMDRAVAAVLALLWVWMGVVYHLGFFRAINPAAAVFGALFVAEGLLLAWYGVVRHELRFRPAGTRGAAGVALLGYAFLIYPFLNGLAGHRYPATPTFGLPCPTTIFTFGLFLWAEQRRWSLLAAPLLWSVVGGSAALLLRVPADYGLMAAGVIAGALSFYNPKPTPIPSALTSVS